MQHSFSSQSFLKREKLNKYNHHNNDITLTKSQLSTKYINQFPSNDYYSHPINNHNNNYSHLNNNYSPNNHNNYSPHHHHNPIQSITQQSPNKSTMTRNQQSLQKLRKKMKQIKYALKIAQQHNQQLHIKLTTQKKSSQQQLINYQKDLNKYKSLYQMLIDSYEKKVDEVDMLKRELEVKQMELGEMRKIVRSYQKLQQGMYCNNNSSRKQLVKGNYQYLERGNINKTNNKNNNINNNKQHPPHTPPSNKLPSPSRKQLSNTTKSPQIKQLLARQQVTLQHLTHQNKILRQQLILKNKKISQFQIIISSYQSQQKIYKSSTKQLSLLTTKITQFQQENQKLLNQKQIISTKLSRLQIELQSIKNKSITTQSNLTKSQHQLQQMKILNQQLHNELSSNKQLINDYQTGQRKGKWKHMYDQLSNKYNQLLKFNYQNQKQFQKQIHLITKQLQRREIFKYNHR